MRQGWKSAAFAALACVVLGVTALPATDAWAAPTKSASGAPAKSASATPAKSASAAPARKSRNALRQFTGVVAAVDKNSITVEKRGKTPKTMVFVRDENTASVGEVVKDGRVTVHYRQDGGQFIAQRVEARSSRRSTSPSSR